jgi:hypothetical protein
MPGATRLTHLKVEVQADFHQGPTLIDTGQAFKQSVSICQHCKHEEYKVFILVVSAVREEVAAFQSSEILIRCGQASRYRHRRLFPTITQLLSFFQRTVRRTFSCPSWEGLPMMSIQPSSTESKKASATESPFDSSLMRRIQLPYFLFTMLLTS